MEALSKAQQLIKDAFILEREDAHIARQDAAVYAAIAQAEAMQLVVKRLEQWMEAQGVGMEMIEAAERGIRYQKENQRLLRRIAVLEGEPVESEYTE